MKHTPKTRQTDSETRLHSKYQYRDCTNQAHYWRSMYHKMRRLAVVSLALAASMTVLLVVSMFLRSAR